MQHGTPPHFAIVAHEWQLSHFPKKLMDLRATLERSDGSHNSTSSDCFWIVEEATLLNRTQELKNLKDESVELCLPIHKFPENQLIEF